MNLPLYAAVVFSISYSVSASEPIALIYDGPGACDEACALSAAETARAAGFFPKIVGPKSLREGASSAEVDEFFSGVEVWIQPGGVAATAMRSMTATLKSGIRQFVDEGGGYVGFCAGAFSSTAKVGSTDVEGLGIFPGRTELYSRYAPVPNPKRPRIQAVNWRGKKREIYFEGGPILRDLPTNVSIIATYPSGHVAAASVTFGKGKVVVTGAHPEAPEWWAPSEQLNDSDGSDRDLAIEMIHESVNGPF